MEAAIQTVVKVFLKSAKGKESLGGKDFQRLVESQLSNILTDTDSKKAVNEMREGLDANQDGKVGFEEYMKLVGYLATSLSQQRISQEGSDHLEAICSTVLVNHGLGDGGSGVACPNNGPWLNN
uniref:S100 calcium binding protein U n=1 Tax=Myripristis murdjan TaxID=586833 RepID=A0A668A2I4_9TELE